MKSYFLRNIFLACSTLETALLTEFTDTLSNYSPNFLQITTLQAPHTTMYPNYPIIIV